MIKEFIFRYMSKDEAINLLTNTDLTEKIYLKHKTLLSHIKMRKKL